MRQIGLSEVTYYWWRQQYGGLDAAACHSPWVYLDMIGYGLTTYIIKETRRHMRKLFLALTTVTLLSAMSLSLHPAKATMLVVPNPNGIQATSPIQTIACHMRQVCSRKTAQCSMRKVCNTPSRSRPQT